MILFFLLCLCSWYAVTNPQECELVWHWLCRHLNAFILAINTEDDEITPSSAPTSTPPPAYETKYLEQIRKMPKDWVWKDDERKQLEDLTRQYYEAALSEGQTMWTKLQAQVERCQRDMREYPQPVQYVECSNEEGDTLVEEVTMEQVKEWEEKATQLRARFYEPDGLSQVLQEASDRAKKEIVADRLSSLQHSFVMEKTPQGNVLMLYDAERSSFQYYADATIPYRYLEVVARKYVKSFQCRPLYVDMEEELHLVETKDKNKEQEAKQSHLAQEKKSVFAKFKQYNTEGRSVRSMAPPPKNNIPKSTKEAEKILLKDRANRYTYVGKMANFSFLQKVERKVFNKRLALTFAEFKQQQQQPKSSI